MEILVLIDALNLVNVFIYITTLVCEQKIVSAYDQETPQSQTADKPVAP